VQQSNAKQALAIYWRHTTSFKRHLAQIFVGVPLATLASDFIIPFLVSRILAELSKAQNTDTTLTLNMLMPYLIGIVAMQVVQLIMWNLNVRSVWKMEAAVKQKLAMTSFNHLMSMSQRFFSNRFGGSLVSQTNKFVNAYERLVDTLTFNVYTLICSFVFTVVILAKSAPLFVVGLVILSALYSYTVYRVKKGELVLNTEWAALETRQTGQLADSITNIAAVKSFAHEDVESSFFHTRTTAVTGISLKNMKLSMRNEVFTNSLQRMIEVLAIAISIWLAINGNAQVGIIYLILTYSISIMRRLWELNFVFRNLNRVFADASDMAEILSIEPEIKDPVSPEKNQINRGQITLNNLTFQHGDGGIKIFNDLNLRIEPGEKIGLVGSSGSGKTTLTQLILRLMDIHGGQILIDGQNIAAITQADLRSKIAYVPQEPIMFHRSIMENIRYGQLDASDEAVIEAAKLAHAHEFIESLPKGYETMVGERGTKLSGGQRQRVAIARAMLKNAPILILDEATSALDSESEVLIQDALWKLMEGRTAIVIAHRLSTIQKMDRILVMAKGVIVEQGSHAALLQHGGTYAKLWSHQSGGFIEE
jgi:ATP-binding cassette, subfamily B, bacterial